MRIYPSSSEETLRASKLLKAWAADGLITDEQYQLLGKETVSDLRTTNIFLRLVLLLFTLICVAAFAALFWKIFLSGSSDQIGGIFLLICAAACYAAAEAAATRARLYRYGIEEALAVCAVGFLCLGMESAFFRGVPYSPTPDAIHFLVPAAGAAFSLWIWRRFGLWYAFVAAMIFAIFVPGYWTSSHPAQHGVIALLYALGLIIIVALRSQPRVDSIAGYG